MIPGLALAAGLAALAYALAALPGGDVVGPLVLALVVGLAWRRAFGITPRVEPGTRVAARTILKFGVVLLGVRLDLRALAEVGWTVLFADLLVVAVGFLLADLLGRALRLPRGLRLSLGLGTSICGASAIVAGATVTEAREREVSVAIAVISVVGTLAVLGYTLLERLVDPSTELLGLLIGATLQEVGHVVAAGYGAGPETGDLATLVKMSRVALLAPVLLLLGFAQSRRTAEEPRSSGAPRAPILPWFLTGFLALGVLNSLGWVPPGLHEVLYRASVLLTTVAMAGIGLQVALDDVLDAGTPALFVGTTAFLGVVGAMSAYGLLASG